MKTIHALVVTIIIFTICLTAEIQPLEERLSQTMTALETVRSRLDSLNQELNRLAILIETEKRQSLQNSKKTAAWYDQIFVLSRTIDDLKNQVQQYQAQIHDIRNRLDALYAGKLDTLLVQLQNTTDSGRRWEIEKEISVLSQRRVALLPPFGSLSFSLEKINEIDLSKASDSLEYDIYSDYLKNARKEVNTILNNINESRRELEEMTLLQERSSRFLEEINEDRPLSLYTVTDGQRQAGGTFEPGQIFTAPPTSVPSQAQSLYYLFNQLNIPTDQQWIFRQPIPGDSLHSGLSVDEYLQNLQTAEDVLNDYLQLIDQKLR